MSGVRPRGCILTPVKTSRKTAPVVAAFEAWFTAVAEQFPGPRLALQSVTPEGRVIGASVKGRKIRGALSAPRSLLAQIWQNEATLEPGEHVTEAIFEVAGARRAKLLAQIDRAVLALGQSRELAIRDATKLARQEIARALAFALEYP